MGVTVASNISVAIVGMWMRMAIMVMAVNAADRRRWALRANTTTRRRTIIHTLQQTRVRICLWRRVPVKLHMIMLAISTELRLDSCRVYSVGVQTLAYSLSNEHVFLGAVWGGDAECNLDVH